MLTTQLSVLVSSPTFVLCSCKRSRQLGTNSTPAAPRTRPPRLINLNLQDTVYRREACSFLLPDTPDGTNDHNMPSLWLPLKAASSRIFCTAKQVPDGRSNSRSNLSLQIATSARPGCVLPLQMLVFPPL